MKEGNTKILAQNVLPFIAVKKFTEDKGGYVFFTIQV